MFVRLEKGSFVSALVLTIGFLTIFTGKETVRKTGSTVYSVQVYGSQIRHKQNIIILTQIFLLEAQERIKLIKQRTL